MWPVAIAGGVEHAKNERGLMLEKISMKKDGVNHISKNSRVLELEIHFRHCGGSCVKRRG